MRSLLNVVGGSALLGLVPFAQVAAAQEPELVRVEVVVTAVSGGSAYLDRGQNAGLRTGDVVRLQPLGAPSFTAVVRSVSKQSARVELPAGTTGVTPSITGEVLIPAARQTADVDVDHPPWEAGEEAWDPDAPLLAPPSAQDPSERSAHVSGSVRLDGDVTIDDAGDREYGFARAGIDFLHENPLGHGGAFEFEADLDHRSSDLSFGSDESDTNFRIERFSYAVGGTRSDPRFLQVGRFLQSEFPEFGVLDGAEVAWRGESGSRFGASAGFLPEYSAEMKTGDDLALSVWWAKTLGDEELDLGVGVQKTWHEGEADRDLVVGHANWRPSDDFFLWTTTWVDLYGSGDVVKDSGPELTQFSLTANWLLEGGRGFGVNASHVRWPELLRNEFDPLPAAELSSTKVTRVGVNGWLPVGKRLRLDGRVSAWQDEDDDGFSGEVRASWRDVPVEQTSLDAALYFTEGAFSALRGLRLGLRGFTNKGFWQVSFESALNEQSGFTGVQQELLQHTLRGSWDRSFGSDWDGSLYLEQRFGDEQDSTSIGLGLRRSF